MAAPKRTGRPYERLKSEARRRHAEADAPCALCHRPINYDLRFPNPGAWSLDHRVPLHAGGPMMDPANVQPAHFSCNSSRGASEGNRKRKRTQTIEHTSTRW